MGLSLPTKNGEVKRAGVAGQGLSARPADGAPGKGVIASFPKLLETGDWFPAKSTWLRRQCNSLFNFRGCSASLPGPGEAELRANLLPVYQGACRGRSRWVAEVARGPDPHAPGSLATPTRGAALPVPLSGRWTVSL